MQLIGETVGRFPRLSRMELALTLCENLPWKAHNGRSRLQSCLQLLEQFAAAEIIRLPAKRTRARSRATPSRAAPVSAPEIAASLGDLRPVTVEPVASEECAVWNATVARHHPLGFERAFGAHQRYWVCGVLRGERVVLGAMLFAAPARNVAVRDVWLGWTKGQQQRFRERVVANSRMLILPGVRVPHLASHALSRALRRLRDDWRARFGYAPVVVETFVSPPWHGTCYRAANWVHLGQTSGEGRQDRRYAWGGTVREVFAYPLVRDWREALVADEPPVVLRPGGRPRPSGQPAGGDEMLTAEQRLNEMTEERIRQRFEFLTPRLNEKQRRLFAGAEAIAYGAGGQKRVAALLGMSQDTVHRGMREARHPETVETERVRRSGGGRKPTTESDTELPSDLESLVSPSTRGDPQSPLRWTCKSTRKLAAELNAMKPGRAVSDTLVRKLLHEMGYSLHALQKTREGTAHPDRDAQFQHINATVQDYQGRGQPVVSVDTKKKELVGDFKNAGREWQPQGQPETVRIHDFVVPELGKVNPYGVSDPARNEGWVNVGTDHDTAAFAVASIRGWWHSMGQAAYPNATDLLITADGGGSNNARCRLWKVELQNLADELGLTIGVCHLPPGTSKWNKVEHRLFSHITQNWRGRPLTSHEVILGLIANTTTAAGLKVQCALDTHPHRSGIKVPDPDLADLRIEPHQFHGNWNYVVRPRRQS